MSSNSLRTWIVLAALTLPVAAQGGVPDPRNSVVPRCLVVCPAGDVAFSVVVRDPNNLPVNGSLVNLGFCPCATIHFCPPQPTDGYTLVGACDVQIITGPSGIATFNLRAGGSCASPVAVSADGVLLATVPLEQSPDQDGSLVVDAADAALLAAKVGGADLTGDLDCSNDVTAADQAVLAAHLGHACDNRTPALQRSWGQVKGTYR